MPRSDPQILVQVFGRDDSRETRAAIRFFRERRIEPHRIDLRRKPISPGEVRRFVERLGARALADTAGRSWRDAGLGYLSMTDAELVDRLLADQRLLRLPLVRIANGVAAGLDEPRWRTLLAEAAS
ncbi:MAG TPA: ArsC/Spx/MgsR family protein [Candidatus Limnocylindrales bacterium]|nr:ArsC/Spx/MgsR family protein [Candidatus Limnocylindrales bacterium]